MAEPIVDFDLLSTDEDVESLTVGVGVLLDLLDSPAVSAMSGGFFVDDRGTPVAEVAGSPDAVHDWLRSSSGDYVHAAGTCAMGDPGCRGPSWIRALGWSESPDCGCATRPSFPVCPEPTPTSR